jgi:periplasmic protein CpxP/Spy
MKNRSNWLLATLAIAGMSGVVCAQSASSPGDSTPPPANDADHGPGGRWHHHGGPGDGMMRHVLHELNLTDAQKQSVHQIMATARTQAQSQRQNGTAPNFAALENPGDPNHAAALQDFQTRMTAHMQAEEQVRTQIYGVLTPAQKTQLASILAAQQAKMAAHSATG